MQGISIEQCEHGQVGNATMAQGALAGIRSSERADLIDLGLDSDVELGCRAPRGLAIAIAMSAALWLAIGALLWKLIG